MMTWSKILLHSVGDLKFGLSHVHANFVVNYVCINVNERDIDIAPDDYILPILNLSSTL